MKIIGIGFGLMVAVAVVIFGFIIGYVKAIRELSLGWQIAVNVALLIILWFVARELKKAIPIAFKWIKGKK